MTQDSVYLTEIANLRTELRAQRALQNDDQRLLDQVRRALLAGGARPDLGVLAMACTFAEIKRNGDDLLDEFLGLLAGEDPTILPGPGIDDAVAIEDLKQRVTLHLDLTSSARRRKQ